MDAKRWSLLGAFAAGSLSSALVVGWVASDVDSSEAVTANVSGTARVSSSARVNASDVNASDVNASDVNASDVNASDVNASDVNASDVNSAPRGEQAAPEAEPATSIQALAAPAPAPSAHTDADAEEANGTGDSVADVLAQLEKQYRHGEPVKVPAAMPSATAAPTPAPSVVAEAPPPVSAPSASSPSASSDTKLPPDAKPMLVAMAEPPKVPLAAAPVTAADESAPTAPNGELPASAAELPAAVALAARDAQDVAAVERGQQRITAQLQQVAALQQATIAQQFAMLQYLQLFALSSTPRASVPAAPPRRGRGQRIVDTLPSSISASDNPWGFEYPAPVLLH